MNPKFKTVVFWIVVALSATLLWQVVRAGSQAHKNPDISYSEFMSKVDAGEVVKVSIAGSRIQGLLRDGKAFSLTGPDNTAAYVNQLHEKGVEVWFRDAPSDSAPLALLSTWAPLFLLVAVWFFMVRQLRRKREPPTGGNPSSPIEPH